MAKTLKQNTTPLWFHPRLGKFYPNHFEQAFQYFHFLKLAADYNINSIITRQQNRICITFNFKYQCLELLCNKM